MTERQVRGRLDLSDIREWRREGGSTTKGRRTWPPPESGCAETGEDERCREDERRGGGAETRSAARLRRLSEDLVLWLRSCLAVP